MRIDGFEWDEGNIEKNLLKHNVTPEETVARVISVRDMEKKERKIYKR